MTSSIELGAPGVFSLPPADGARLVRRQAVWTLLAGLVAFGAWLVGGADGAVAPVVLGVAVGLGAAASGALAPWLALAAVALTTLPAVLADQAGVPVALAVGLGAGLAVGGGGVLPRIEAALAGVAGAGFADWLVAHADLPAGVAAPLAIVAVAYGASTALVPGALAFRARGRIPSPGRIQATLGESYRPACMRAWQLDRELAPAAPDRDARDGVQEVAGWVYRLALTLQTLDADVARIDPADVAARRLALADDATDDPFVLDRRASTDRHLARMLEHRDALAAERLRTAALQDYALAWLEEARAGLAVAREQPGETPPERLDQVLDKLRGHAADRDARRAADRELRAR